MIEAQNYSAKSVYDALLKTFHQYLSAQYHIWDESLIEERNRLFTTVGVTNQEPRIESTPIYAPGQPYTELKIPTSARRILTEASMHQGTGVPKVPYLHQAQALELFLNESSDLIVATGTGSGKTESFLMPIIGQLAIESESRPNSWNKPGVRALLLYPMNALVNDQLSRLRRLFGNHEIARSLKGARLNMATFGMYTSRTAYPGLRTKDKDKNRVGNMLARLFTDGMSEENKKRLLQEGKWPAKDIEGFLNNSFHTSNDDCELYTRQEMQDRAPDILVTNYSMLEYMMLRPIEANIFDQTKLWLEESNENKFTIVLDEAHMYRGSAGAEVAYLLRRLHSRLGVTRDRVRYILTSASLGSDDKARASIIRFAARLTGADEISPNFSLVTGTLEKRPVGGAATNQEQKALAEFKYSVLHDPESDELQLKDELEKLTSSLGGKSALKNTDIASMRAEAFRLLSELPVANMVANKVTATPVSLRILAETSFPFTEGRSDALESLLALMAFAREEATGKPFAPIRSHLFFRGLPGLFACTNAACTQRVENTDGGPLGRLFSSSRLRCECGARVYELLTHRACGAAYIRGFLKSEDGDFLWHEASTGVWSDTRLIEAQIFVAGVESKSNENNSAGPYSWLSTKTGQLFPTKPISKIPGDFLRVVRPLKLTKDNGRDVLTIDSDCPACKKGTAPGAPKAMDLATKGEAPFAHLVRTQVATQPRLSIATSQSPNGGRKTLLFSDGRQKAARLARDIPRAIELDVFRQLLMLAACKIIAIGEEPRLSGRMYAAFLCSLAQSGLQLFDGDDREAIRKDVGQLERFYGGDLKEAIDQFESAPPRFTELLLKQLCANNYSISALTLGYVAPANSAIRQVCVEFPELTRDELYSLGVSWIQGLLNAFAFDHLIPSGIRREANPYGFRPASPTDGFSKQQRAFLESRGVDFEKLVDVLSKSMCEVGSSGGIYLIPKRTKIDVAIDKAWYQCGTCRSAQPVSWWGHCSNCSAPGVTKVNAGSTSYLRARKGFWRDPVAGVISGTEEMVNLSVEEHTAQLSYKDVDEPTTTTEEFERRFRDILIRPADTAIDVLSCTTTMEVGIDIGSLVAVGMRNVPPMRQNYQQRAGRAGRRGTSISTVMTYAQNGAHDSYYFQRPDSIISGAPPSPILDTDNVKIITRHIHAQLVQDFFRPRAATQKSGDIFTALGDTWTFFDGNGPTSFSAFKVWISSSVEAQTSLARASDWLPKSLSIQVGDVATAFIASLELVRPSKKEGLEEGLIDFLFNKALLPSYAFPRDICSLQIERTERGDRGTQVKIIEKPQQSLNVALSEYAPGRLVVVNKKTYRVGSVTANSVKTEVNRAEALFERGRAYVHCTECLYTAGFVEENHDSPSCPHCGSETLQSVTVITPETVFPRGKDQIDEFDDEQQFSQTTGAQLPLADSTKPLVGERFGINGTLSKQRQQPLVMVNIGSSKSRGEDGFLVCDLCGRVLLDGEKEGQHDRDYYVQNLPGRVVPLKCNGGYKKVYLGYGFSSDVLLMRFKIEAPIKFDFVDSRRRKPLEDALQSLSEAIVLSMSRELDIDSREVSAGFRFASVANEIFADIFIYDTLSGGAGYAYQAGDRIGRIFDETENLLTECDCGASCEKCLRHYGNRFHHGILDRNLALDVAKYIRRGEFPSQLTHSQQIWELAPLAEMLALAAWTVESDSKIPLRASKGNRDIEVYVAPSLAVSNPIVRRGSTTIYTFTPYELSRDLASAYGEIA